MSTPTPDRSPAGAAGPRGDRRRPWRRGRVGVAFVVGVALALAACSPSTPEPEPSTTTTPAVDLAKKARPAPLPARWPLTGVAGEVTPRPALSVKIENSAAARPQTGLEDADVVWEEMVEGGITRFNAVYHSAVPDVLGPVRSVRPMDAAISGPLGGVMAFSGGQPQFVQQIRDAGLQVLSNDEGVRGLYRVKFRRAPHNVYGSGPDLLAQADGAHSAPPAEQLRHAWDAASASAVKAGTPASRIVLAFPSAAPGWTWDGAADAGRGGGPGVWARDERGAAQVSADGVRIVATNVVVLRVQVVDTGARDPAGLPVPETVLTGNGQALVATGGKVLEGTWSKAGTRDPLALTAADGTPLTIAPGNTWIELVPVNGGVTVQ
ncbi:DUF3048 domain-containing protein [Georgenia sp. SYP-B2076]|uniref:DUF3048 domain-containing protein n=1 Tax=Georgenia sp. SYP-B2076 TaxID=2495881 RepID=UPI000F8CA685|nr:DUF3048 domain-containing protein [Georgenia sp. SYP-B2076]